MDATDGEAFFPREMIKDIGTAMKLEVKKTQKHFCEEIQKLEESKTFIARRWKSENGEGRNEILENGDVFEKVVVCTSVATGVLPGSAFCLLENRNPHADIPKCPTYFTAGVSGVVYPKNPHVPTLNFNYRYFEIKTDENSDEGTWWFGGGSDLTPYILNEDDCLQFHKVLKICCDKFDKNYYKTFKKACDEHFYLKHRGEARGIGGIFFNKLNGADQEKCFMFVSFCMKNIIPSYMPIVIKNKDKSYFNQDKEWQLQQRGRYVEFCFICDKAARLVMMTPGVEYENILIYLPPTAKWKCNHTTEKNSKQQELLEILQNPVDWV